MAAASKTTKKSSAGTGMAVWEAELAKRAEASAKTAQSVAAGYKSISTRSGIFTIDGEAAGRDLKCVILAWTLENAYYTNGYDPDNPSNPVCFAFGDDAKTMAPVEKDVQELQSPQCKGCPMNDFGSADTGRGKACKNQAKLLVLDENDLDDLENAEPRTLKVPVTSVKHLSGYVKNLSDKFKRPPLAVLTNIHLEPDAKTQFSMTFQHDGDINDGELIGELLKKSDSLAGDLQKPYEVISEEEQASRRASKSAGGKARGRVVESTPSRGVAARKPAAKVVAKGRGR